MPIRWRAVRHRRAGERGRRKKRPFAKFMIEKRLAVKPAFFVDGRALATSRPEGAARQPEAPASRPEAPASRPEGAASRPASRPEAPASRPEGAASRPEGAASRPEGAASRPEGAARQPKPWARGWVGPASPPMRPVRGRAERGSGPGPRAGGIPENKPLL